jgi:hypothetical protein
MSFLNKLLRRANAPSSPPRADEAPENEPPTAEASPEPTPGPVWQPAEQTQLRSTFEDLKEQAESALREAVEQVQAVVARARNHVDQIQHYQEQARAAVEQGQGEAEAAPGNDKAEATVMAAPDRQVVTEASAGMLMEYLRHVFDLVSMENRLIEKRLDSLQESLDRLDRRFSNQAAEVSSRFDALDAVQLPLVRELPAIREPRIASDTARASAPTGPDDAAEVKTRPATGGVEGTLAIPGEALLEDNAPVFSEPAQVASEPVVAAQDKVAWPSDLASPVVGEAITSHEPFAGAGVEADSGTTAAAEPVGVTTPLEPASAAVASAEADAEAPYDGPPVEGTLVIAGLATFRMLASVRDALQNSGYVLAAEPLRFEAGDAQLRVRATRPLKPVEIQEWLANATGAAVESVGDMSFRVLGARADR